MFLIPTLSSWPTTYFSYSSRSSFVSGFMSLRSSWSRSLCICGLLVNFGEFYHVSPQNGHTIFWFEFSTRYAFKQSKHADSPQQVAIIGTFRKCKGLELISEHISSLSIFVTSIFTVLKWIFLDWYWSSDDSLFWS
jgi:hypothetical protein